MALLQTMRIREVLYAVILVAVFLVYSPSFAQNPDEQKIDGKCNIQIGGDAQGDVSNNCNFNPVAPITDSPSEKILFSAIGQVSFDPHLDAPNYRKKSTTILDYRSPEYGTPLELRVVRQGDYLEPIVHVAGTSIKFEPPRWGTPTEVWDLGRTSEYFHVNDDGNINLQKGFTYHFTFAAGKQGAALVAVIEGVQRNHVVAITLPLSEQKNRLTILQQNNIDRVLITQAGDIEILSGNSIRRETVIGNAFYSP